MILLSEYDVAQLLTTAEAIPLLEAQLRLAVAGQAENIPRRRARSEGYVLHVLPAASAGPHLGAKLYLSGGASVPFVYLLFGASGLEALIAADYLGRTRTGAASGLATKYLAKPAASRLVIFGAGNQALSQVEAVLAVRPIRHITICNRSDERAQAFAAKLRGKTDAEIEITGDIARAVAGADIISTMTSAKDPLFCGSDLAASVHINAAGSNRATNAEIDHDTLARASSIFVEDVEQAKLEAGDFLRDPSFDWARIQPLSEIFTYDQAEKNEITLFESLGIGLWDLALAVELVERARSQGLGQEVNLDGFFRLP